MAEAPDWVILPDPKAEEEREREATLRLVTAVSEVQNVLGSGSNIKLGDVSAAVRKFDFNTALAVEYLLQCEEARHERPVVPQQRIVVEKPKKNQMQGLHRLE